MLVLSLLREVVDLGDFVRHHLNEEPTEQRNLIRQQEATNSPPREESCFHVEEDAHRDAANENTFSTVADPDPEEPDLEWDSSADVDYHETSVALIECDSLLSMQNDGGRFDTFDVNELQMEYDSLSLHGNPGDTQCDDDLFAEELPLDADMALRYQKITRFASFADWNRVAERIRLRRRDTSQSDAVEAGFEPVRETPPRCNSTHSLGGAVSLHPLPFPRSQFDVRHFEDARDRRKSREFSAPTAVVGPRQGGDADEGRVERAVSRDRSLVEHRRSLQALNGSGLYGISYSEYPSGDQHYQVEGRQLSEQLVGSQSADRGRMPRHADRDAVFLGGHPAYHTGQITPTSHRRSIQQHRGAFDGPHTSTPINKMVVQPIPHRSSSSRQKDERRVSGQLPSYSHYMRGGGGDEIIVDAPPSPSDKGRVKDLEQRVRELESMVTQSLTPTLHTKSHHHRVGSSSSQAVGMQQQMAAELADKECEIDRLQSQLRKTYSRMELQQAQYDEEVRAFKRDGEAAKQELLLVKQRLNELETECGEYRDRAADAEQSKERELRDALARIAAQDEELARLRSAAGQGAGLHEELERAKEEIDYLELQNDALNTSLEQRDASVKQLEESLSSMRLEASLYQQSCSSGSTPLADDDVQSLADVRTPSEGGARRYAKAHSTVGAHTMRSSPQLNARTPLSKSLSSYQIEQNRARGEELTPAISQILRSQQKKVVDCRLLVRCLKESAEKAVHGETPDLSRLLGIRTDSLSESETEQVAFDSTAMNMHTAEKHLRNQEETLSRLERDLDCVRHLVQQWYTERVRDSAESEESCRVQ